MIKKRLFILLLMTTLLSACAQEQVTYDIKSNKNIKMTGDYEYKEKYILAFDIEKLNYSFRIYEIIEGKEVLVFDSALIGLIYKKGNYEVKMEDHIHREDKDKNGVPEIYFSGYIYDENDDRDASVYPNLAIVEKIDGEYKCLFNGKLEYYDDRDVDQDGKLELYGYTTWSIPEKFLTPREIKVFKRQNDQYIYSEECTQKLWDDRLIDAEAMYLEMPSYDNFEWLLSMYVFFGLEGKGYNLIEEFLLYDLKETGDKNYYRKQCKYYKNVFKESLIAWEEISKTEAGNR